MPLVAWQDEEGISLGIRGEETIKWGPDVTRDFLSRSGIEIVVRSHQLPRGGRGYGNMVLPFELTDAMEVWAA